MLTTDQYLAEFDRQADKAMEEFNERMGYVLERVNQELGYLERSLNLGHERAVRKWDMAASKYADWTNDDGEPIFAPYDYVRPIISWELPV